MLCLSKNGACRRILKRSGMVMCKRGFIGSGSFIDVSADSEVALLTSKHVVLEAAMVSQVSIKTTSPEHESFGPSAIWIDGSRDVALLYVPKEKRTYIPAIFSKRQIDWTGRVKITRGRHLLASGFPGLIQDKPDHTTHTYDTNRLLHFWTHVKRVRGENGCFVLDVDRKSVGLPASFRGISGGPVVSRYPFKLVGINDSQSKDVTTINVLPLPLFCDFRKTAIFSNERVGDALFIEGKTPCDVVSLQSGIRRPAEVYYILIWSKSSPTVPKASQIFLRQIDLSPGLAHGPVLQLSAGINFTLSSAPVFEGGRLVDDLSQIAVAKAIEQALVKVFEQTACRAVRKKT